jgi:putative membrane protein
MSFILERGFFGSEAPFFIDFSIIIFFLLPVFIGGGIFLAKRELIKLHIIVQLAVFLATTTILVLDIFWFNQANPKLNSNLIFYLYIIFLALLYAIWYRTIYFAIEDSRRMALPGLYSQSHKRSGRVLLALIIINPFLGMIAYYLNFIN